MSVNRIYCIEELCLMCKRCEVYCATAHSKATGGKWALWHLGKGQIEPDFFDIVKAYGAEKEPLSRVAVLGDLSASVALNCRHCEDAPCVRACITGAMRQDEKTGVVNCDESKCVGCRTCVLACPFGAVRVRGKALKCDFCGDGEGSEGTPACVEACPTHALVLCDVERG